MTTENTPDGLAIIEGSDLGENTKKHYGFHWKRWEGWCQEEGAPPLDATADQALHYLDAKSLKRTSITRFCTVLSFVCRSTGGKNITEDPRLFAARRGPDYKPSGPTPERELSSAVAERLKAWLKRYLAWCKSKGKDSLPAEPDYITQFLREISCEKYSLITISTAALAIARYHQEHGYDDTNKLPEVRALMDELRAQATPTQRGPGGVGSAPRTVEGYDRHRKQWRRWCSNNNVDSMEATPADLCDYLQWKSTRVGYKRLRDSVTGISKMYEAGASPTDAEEVMALLAEIKKQKAAEKQTGKKDTEKPPGQGDITLEAPDIEALLSSSVPPGLDEDDLARIKEAYVARLSSSTSKKYRGSWESYQKWCNDRGVPAEGAEPLHVAAYICQLAQGLDVATVSNHLSAIRCCYRSLRPYDNPAMYPIVSNTLTGLRRQDPHPPDQMDPIGELGYAVIAQRAQEPRSGEKPNKAILRGAIDIAVIGLMRDALLRLRETVAARWDHLEREEDGTGLLTVPFSKTDQTGAGEILYVSAATMEAIDAMCKIKRQLGIETPEDDRIFGLSPNGLTGHIRHVCRHVGLKGRFGGHSPRIGMAQDLARASVSLPNMMLAGRWKDPAMPGHYIRNILAASGAVAEWYARDPERGRIRVNPLDSYGDVPRYTGERVGT